MLATAIILFLACLFGSYCLTSLSIALRHFHKHALERKLRKNRFRFFYLPIHQLLFRKTDIPVLFSAINYAKHLYILGYGAASILLALTLKLDDNVLSWVGLAFLLVLFVFIFVFFVDLIAKKQKSAPSPSTFTFLFFTSSCFITLTLPILFIFLHIYHYLCIKIPQATEPASTSHLKEKILTVLEQGTQAPIDINDKKLITSVLNFKDRIVREVMIPRVDVFCLSVDTPLKEAMEEIIEEGYSRIPIYKENIDDIVGILLYKDILKLYYKASNSPPAVLDKPIGDYIKEVIFTPETKKVSHLLQEFRQKQMHLAIVVDEYGGTEGIVTIEDLLEEIVGEISDEYDYDEEVLFTSQPDGSWIVDGRMSLIDIAEKCGIRIPQEGDYDTIGGYIFHRAGEIPPKGLRIHHDDFDIEILSSSERCVEKIRIVPRVPEES